MTVLRDSLGMTVTFLLYILSPTISIIAPARREGAISVAFVRPSVCLSVRPSVAYIANNSRTQRPSLPKFGRKVRHHRCDSHTRFKVKLSKVTRLIEAGGGIPCRPNTAATLIVNHLSRDDL